MEDKETDVEIVQEGKQGKKEEVNIDPPTRQEAEYHSRRTKNNKASETII